MVSPFIPPRCPYPDCSASHPQNPFPWRRRGRFHRKCDGRSVQRFQCLTCERRFSSQTFRFDYRLKKPRLHFLLFDEFISKCTMRHSARLHGLSRKTVSHRLERIGRHCEKLHRHHLAHAAVKGGLSGVFQLDELETFETDRRLQPVTVPVLIERSSYFVLHTAVASLPARGGLVPRDRKRKEEREERFGKRRSGSSRVVRESFEVLREAAASRPPLLIQTDRKKTYQSLLTRVFGDRAQHHRISSKAKRSYTNPLFPINHTLAMMRDALSRLVRRNWANSKKRSRLRPHLWVWVVWRNYVRGITVKAPKVTPAMALRVSKEKWSKRDLFRWSSEFLDLHQVH